MLSLYLRSGQKSARLFYVPETIINADLTFKNKKRSPLSHTGRPPNVGTAHSLVRAGQLIPLQKHERTRAA